MGREMETDSRIAVLHVISGLGLGGAERMLLWSARYHDRDLVKMGVVSLMSGGELADEIRKENVEVHELGQRRGKLSIKPLLRLLAITTQFRPHILQGHMYHSNLLVRIVGAVKRPTIVLSTRHIDHAPPLRRIINGASGFLNDSTLVFSTKVLHEEQRENLFRRSVKLVPYGIEIIDRSEMDDLSEIIGEGDRRSLLREEMKIPPEAFVWIAVGRLTKQKGLVHLIDAFSKVSNTSAGSFLIIVGDGEDRRLLEGRAKETGVSSRVHFCGSKTDTARYFAISDAFVLSSLWEGGPLVILEAMAAELPIVSTSVGDVRSMVEEGKNGILIEPGDVGQLADAMNKVQAMERSAVRDWGLCGRRKVEEYYDFRCTQRKMEQFYDELVHGQKLTASTVRERGKEG
jgi:glycosyltransferase involved in cell wall biosynthesis